MVLYLVEILIFTKRLIIFLNGLVGEMDHKVVGILFGVLFRGGADVSIAVPVAFENAIDCCQKDVASNVEFAVVDEKAVFYIFLDDKWGTALGHSLFYLLLQWFLADVDRDAKTSIRVLARFNNPHIHALLILTKHLTVVVKFPQWETLLIIDVVCNRHDLKWIRTDLSKIVNNIFK